VGILHAECARFPKQRSSSSGKSDLRQVHGKRGVARCINGLYSVTDNVLIKTQRDDKVGHVLVRQPPDLNFQVVWIGKSVHMFN
jgi:hypothetical protein